MLYMDNKTELEKVKAEIDRTRSNSWKFDRGSK